MVVEAVGPSEHLDDRVVLADEIASRLDGVAAHIQKGAASTQFLFPKPVGVRAAVGFARANGQYFADAALLNELPSFDDRRAKDFGLGVTVQDAGRLDGIEHFPRFMAIASQGFG